VSIEGRQVRFGESPKPARESRALPRIRELAAYRFNILTLRLFNDVADQIDKFILP
jgi:hypothetical protein